MPDGDDNTPASATGGSGAQDDNPRATDPGTLTGNVTPPNLGNELSYQQLVERRSASWAALSSSMHDTSTSSLAVNTPECQVPGLSSFSHAELNVIRMVLGHISYLAHVLYAVLKCEQPSKLQSLSDGVRQAIAMKTVCTVDNAPCKSLEPSESYASMLSAMGYSDADSNVVLHPCFEKWTTASGLARDLLCPAYMATYCWIGHKFCPKLLSFPFSFAVDDSTFSSVWFACPVTPDGNMFATLKEDANTRRAAVDVNSPGAAIMKIVSEIEPQLLMVVRSVHDWCLSKNLVVTVASRGYQGIHLLQLVKSEAVQYRDCTTAISGQKRSHYRSYVKLRGLKDSIKKPEIPFLKWYGEIKHTQGLSQAFITRCDQEEREDSDSLTAALKHAIVPPDFGTSRSDVIKQMFIVHILWEDKNCPLCARRNPPHMCTFKTCKWLRDNLPDQIYRPLVTARGDQQIVPLTTGQEVASPAPSHKKRGRPGYDSSTSRNPVSPRSPGINSKRQKSPFREHIC